MKSRYGKLRIGDASLRVRAVWWSAWAAALAAVVLGRNEVAVPAQKLSGRGNGRNLGQRLVAQSLGLGGETAPVIVREPETPDPIPGPEHTVLLSEAIDYVLLLPVDPSSLDKHEQ